MIYKAATIQRWDCDFDDGSRWIPARPVTYWNFKRIIVAWYVLTGKYDALDWENNRKVMNSEKLLIFLTQATIDKRIDTLVCKKCGSKMGEMQDFFGLLKRKCLKCEWLVFPEKTKDNK